MPKRSLTARGREQLTAAKTASNGRSALDEHDSPGEATLLVLQGRVQHTSPTHNPALAIVIHSLVWRRRSVKAGLRSRFRKDPHNV